MFDEANVREESRRERIQHVRRQSEDAEERGKRRITRESMTTRGAPREDAPRVTYNSASAAMRCARHNARRICVQEREAARVVVKREEMQATKYAREESVTQHTRTKKMMRSPHVAALNRSAPAAKMLIKR